ncbi:hypothetical protein ABPG75_003316 [Micractinium tetrahymenae]
MATLVLQPVHAMEHVHRSFKGDNDMLVDRLIAASARKEVATESLVERALVPFFDSSDASAASFQALQPGRRGAASKPVPVPGGLKRHAHDRSSLHLAGSPPRKEGEVLQAKHARRGSKPSSSASSGGRSGGDSDVEMASPPAQQRKPRSGGKKHQRDGGAAKPAAPAPAGPSGQRQSPLRKRPEPALDMRALAAASAAAGAALRTPGGAPKAASRWPAPAKFAGPAFTNSPTPDCLPIPTSSLLLAEAADGLRARLTL